MTGTPDTSPIYHYAYDKLGNVTSVIDALNNTTTYRYDALSRLVEVIQPDADRLQPVQLSNHPLRVRRLGPPGNRDRSDEPRHDVRVRRSGSR